MPPDPRLAAHRDHLIVWHKPRSLAASARHVKTWVSPNQVVQGYSQCEIFRVVFLSHL